MYKLTGLKTDGARSPINRGLGGMKTSVISPTFYFHNEFTFENTTSFYIWKQYSMCISNFKDKTELIICIKILKK